VILKHSSAVLLKKYIVMIIIKEIFAESIYSFPIIPFTHAIFFWLHMQEKLFVSLLRVITAMWIVELRVL